MIYIKRKSAVQPISGSIVDTTNIENKATNTYSANVIDNLIGTGGGADISTIIDLIYPVGRGFIDFTNTDYSNWLGLTWERELVGMFPVGYNPNDTSFNSLGKTGGEKTHTLTVNEMPSHTHTQNAHKHIGYTSQNCDLITGYINFTSWSGNTKKMNNAGSTAHTFDVESTTATNQNTGGGQAHNNLPPYQVVSYWKRVASSAKKIISFTISGTSYQAEEGMTWTQWCDSNYNTDGDYYYTADSSTVYWVSERNWIESVSKTDIIIANTAYVRGSREK